MVMTGVDLFYRLGVINLVRRRLIGCILQLGCVGSGMVRRRRRLQKEG
jgi:hypothetical protein